MSPSQWEFLATLERGWQLCDTVADAVIIGLENEGLIDTDSMRMPLPAGGVSTSYKRYARITDKGIEALVAKAAA